MIPSVIESQVERGIKDFLRTTFPPSTPFLEGILERLFEEYRSQLNTRNLRSYVLYFATASTNPTNAFVIFAHSGRRDRTQALREAIDAARKRFAEKWGRATTANIKVQLDWLYSHGGLQAVN